jgi:FkbM family methyltransferase
VGGNRGDYTNLLLKNLKNKKITIHIFEPQESCIKILKEKFLNYKNVFINNFGLSNTEESTILYKDSEQSGLASVYKRNLGHYDIQINMSEKIKIKKGIDYIKKEGINKINLLKIDIEGNELKALEGFEDFINPANVEIIQFEYGGANLDSHSSLLELFAFFESRGYCICKIMKRGLEIKKYHPRLENFMYSNYVAINPLIIKKI